MFRMGLYGSKTDRNTLKKSRKDLRYLYASIPETKGCMEHNDRSEEDGGCGSWCCTSISPQVLYVEFLNTWTSICKTWTDNEMMDLIESCIRNYVFGNIYGCVFFDKDSGLCRQHESRPLSCRLYGITPDEEFKPRYERLKVIYPQTRYQCNLVSTVDGREVTKKDTDKWWLQLKNIEVSINIRPDIIHDGQGGSYRSYPEHILVAVFGEETMGLFSEIRIKGDPMMKETLVRNSMKEVKNYLNLPDEVLSS